MRIAIIGQAAFGAAVCKGLRESGHEIVGVFTPADEARRDPLAEDARAHGITLVQPRRWQRKGLVDPDVFSEYTATDPELNVMAFVTQIIPAQVLEHPSLKTIQYHPSLLPKHRGRSAINHAIINGDNKTGITIFWVDKGIDTGPILLQKSVPIGPNDTLNSLYRDQLFPMGVQGMVEAVKLIDSGVAPRITQDETEASYEGPWEGDVAKVDWSQPANRVHNFIRGSDRQPGAWTGITSGVVRLYGSEIVPVDTGPPGSVASIDKLGIVIRCGVGGVRIKSVRPNNGDRISALEWVKSSAISVEVFS